MLNCVVVGLGGFTTFSTFALETTELLKGGSIAVALIYIIASMVLGVLAVMTPQLILK